MVILDTCAIIELFSASPSLTTKTMRLIEAGAYVLSVSFAEIACKVRLGKLTMSQSTRELLLAINERAAFKIVDIGAHEWLDSVDLMWDDNRDPADRLITAFAIKHELPLVTTDQKMKKFYSNVIW